ncbi:MAG: hypothetical protein ACHQ2F_00790 [Desulfobaccales bacterium]
MDKVIAFGPASVANVGPFYDVMGYCLDHLGDIVIAERTNDHNEATLITVEGPFKNDLIKENVATEDNCVQIVAQNIWEEFKNNLNFGVNLTLVKNMPTRSGLGSSSASCVAAAKAILKIIDFQEEGNKASISNWIIEGERAAADQSYPDNIVPSYFGGFYILNRQWQQKVKTSPFYTLVFLKNKAATRTMRNVVTEHFMKIIDDNYDPALKVENILNYLRAQSSYAALIINSLNTNDLGTFGSCMSLSRDNSNFLEECRGDLILGFFDQKEFLLSNGALGCAISGSGPAIACVIKDYDSADKLKDLYLREFGNDCYWLISELNSTGAKIIDDLDQWNKDNKEFHNFWGQK